MLLLSILSIPIDRAEGDHRIPTPECHKKIDNWKELPRGQQVSNETLELHEFCAFDTYWGWGDDPVFEFEVDSTISGVSQHFYLWLYYKEATDQGPFALTINKKGSCSGAVTSISPGINCGNDCTRLYPSGAQVALTASPDSQCLPSDMLVGICFMPKYPDFFILLQMSYYRS
jgi:hypothetical protein